MATSKATIKQLTTVLEAVPLFEGLTQKQLRKVADLADVARFMAGATLVKQGVVGDSFYVVLTGQESTEVIVKIRAGGSEFDRAANRLCGFRDFR